VWWNLFYLDRALETVERNQALLEQFVSIAKIRYQVGKGLQQDILLSQLERSKLKDSAIRLTNSRENEVSRLNMLLGRSTHQAIKISTSTKVDLPALSDIGALQQRAESLRPDLLAQRQRTEAARTRIDLANKDYAPDFSLGAIYGIRGGENPDGSQRADMASVIFTMNLPLFSGSKLDSAVDQRNAEWMQQKYQLDDRRNEIVSEVNRAISDYRHAREQTLLYQNEIIPQARQTVDSMLAGYQVGKIDFLNLVRSQATLYNYETEYWKALSSAYQALARLVAAVGEEKVYE
jgi:outer membrane protein TolC